MKSSYVKFAAIAALSASLGACVVAPSQPIGYRMTSSELPTYVNGQYIGMKPSNYVAPTTNPPATPPATATPTSTSNVAVNSSPAPTAAATATNPPAPVYLQSTNPSVVYMQAPTPVYTYNSYYGPTYYPYGAYPAYSPYYSPFYAAPWFGGFGFGLGARIRIH